MMSEYQVLARKYRPKDFSQLLGQSHVWQALANAIDTKRLHHAYLFTGTRGVGKTTIARILAKCLNCETGITSTPCGVCDTCMSIDTGRFIDLIEIDAASRTKVEDTRDLLENVPYSPTQGRYKVYLIDEVHMLSTHSFNALLKTLEEPPEHVKFILATTDPQKLPITIISRCLQFVLRPMSQVQLHEHLSKVLAQEGIAFTDNAIWQLAESAKGSVRDALSLTDQAIAFGGGMISDESVNGMLGLVNGLDVLNLIDDIYMNNARGVADHITRLRQQMVDAVAVLDRLVDTLHELAMIQYLPLPMDKNHEQKQAFIELSKKISADVIQLYYEIAIKTRDGVRLASTPMQALEMGILRLLAFRPLLDNEMVGIPSIEQHTKKTDEHNIDKNNIDKNNTNDMTAMSSAGAGDNNRHIDDEDIKSDQQNTDHQAYADLHDDQDPIQSGQSNKNLEENTQALDDFNAEPSLAVSQDDTQNTKAVQAKQFKDSEVVPVQMAKTQPKSVEPPDLIGTDVPSDTKTALQEKLLAPPVDLTGKWNAYKWDYWLSLARCDGVFDNDELALLNHSQMMGRIDGDAILYVENHNAQVSASFISAKAKICERLPQMVLGDELMLLTDDDKRAIPYVLQQQRNAEVLISAQNQIIQSPVAQMLWQQGFVIDKEVILSGTKLTLGS
ncbi:DNA polymerase III subunit gamma/tau [Moraxella sp. 7624LN]|uniref:DNA polymerase III subunit gamma/tau n=1 Tax=unclassified Moraxella TaxID=2685852 RepID=UPI003A5D15AC